VHYELVNHLGNVLATVSDRKLGFQNGETFYRSDVLSVQDYYAFGMEMPDRTFNPNAYKYSINGQEKDTDIDANHTTALYWEYDSRIGRRWNLDPVVKEWESPYMCFGDNPIAGNDVLGNTTKDWYKDKDDVVRYDPNVKKQGDLKVGQKYIGETYKAGSASYRKDGSIFYTNETDAYKRISTESKLPKGTARVHEVFGVIMSKGILILPDYLNGATTSNIEKYGYVFNKGKVFDIVTNKHLNLIATIHSHPVYVADCGSCPAPSGDDISKFTKETPNKPFFTMGYDGKIHGNRGPNELNTVEINLPKGYNTVKDLIGGAGFTSLLMSN
jgi:hypothetical protein